MHYEGITVAKDKHVVSGWYPRLRRSDNDPLILAFIALELRCVEVIVLGRYPFRSCKSGYALRECRTILMRLSVARYGSDSVNHNECKSRERAHVKANA